MKEMLGHVYWGNTVESYLLALACIVIGFVVLRIIKNYVLTRLKKVVSKTESNLDLFNVEEKITVDWTKPIRCKNPKFKDYTVRVV